MLFEVFKNEERVFYTEDKSCIYKPITLKQMYSSGYKFKLNGKRIALNKLLQEAIKI